MLRLWKSKPKPKTVDEIVELCNNNVNRILNWILQNVWYVSDVTNHKIKEYPQTPEETLTGIYKNGDIGKAYSGDCEDFSILAQACLRKVGVPSRLLAVFHAIDWAGDIPSKWEGHGVVAFMYKGAWYHFSNWGLKYTSAECLEDVPKNVYKHGYWYEMILHGDTLTQTKITTF